LDAKRVLVTGGAGFIGSHVCQAYRDEGWEVTALDDLSTGRRANVPDGVELVEMDLRSDDLERLFVERGGFHLVNHHAAQIDVRVSVDRPRHDAAINLDGLLNLLERARRHGTERFVFVSSGGVVYGETERLPIPEDHPKRPLSPYGVSKLAGEHYLFCYRKVHGLPYVALRYANVYGPRQDPHGEAGVVAIFGGRLLDGRPLTIFGDGGQTRDYVYVEDVARANLLASTMEMEEPDRLDEVAYNVGTGREVSVNELADTMMRATDREVPVRHDDPRPGELRRNALRVDRLREEGWEPATDLEEGLRRTVDHLASARGVASC
jgi:UDP-glucose 4-epimerase